MTEQEFKREFYKLADYYNHTITEKQIELYHSQLQRLHIRRFSRICAHIKNNRKTFPTAQIIKDIHRELPYSPITLQKQNQPEYCPKCNGIGIISVCFQVATARFPHQKYWQSYRCDCLNANRYYTVTTFKSVSETLKQIVPEFHLHEGQIVDQLEFEGAPAEHEIVFAVKSIRPQIELLKPEPVPDFVEDEIPV